MALLDRLVREGVDGALHGGAGAGGTAGNNSHEGSNVTSNRVPARITLIAALDGRTDSSESPCKVSSVRAKPPVVVLGEGGKTVEVEPEGTLFDPNTLQPIRGFSLHPERDAMTFVEDPAGYLEVLKKSVHFERDWSAKTTCGLVLTGTFITFVIPTGPADVIESNGNTLQPKDEIVMVNGVPVTAETVGDALKGSGISLKCACVANWSAEASKSEVFCILHTYVSTPSQICRGHAQRSE